jgi:hypothetical protein
MTEGHVTDSALTPEWGAALQTLPTMTTVMSVNQRSDRLGCRPISNEFADQSHSTAQHSTAQHSTAQHSTAQHSTAQHSTAQRRIAWHRGVSQH